MTISSCKALPSFHILAEIIALVNHVYQHSLGSPDGLAIVHLRPLPGCHHSGALESHNKTLFSDNTRHGQDTIEAFSAQPLVSNKCINFTGLVPETFFLITTRLPHYLTSIFKPKPTKRRTHPTNPNITNTNVDDISNMSSHRAPLSTKTTGQGKSSSSSSRVPQIAVTGTPSIHHASTRHVLITTTGTMAPARLTRVFAAAIT